MRVERIIPATGASKSTGMRVPPKYVLPGGGPWRILPECPSFIHNTLRSTRGRIHNCICPRALDLREASLEKLRKANAAARAARQQNTGRGSAPTYMANIKSEVGAPNLEGAPCSSKTGVLAMDLMLSEANSLQAKGRALHRKLCAACPVETHQRCDAWWREAETPAGAWGGMYAGKTRKERVQDAGA